MTTIPTNQPPEKKKTVQDYLKPADLTGCGFCGAPLTCLKEVVHLTDGDPTTRGFGSTLSRGRYLHQGLVLGKAAELRKTHAGKCPLNCAIKAEEPTLKEAPVPIAAVEA